MRYEPYVDRTVAEGWHAWLRLELACDEHGRSRLLRAPHEGPLRVQRPFYPEGPEGPCHVYVLHPPGGVVTGDALELEAKLASDTSALLTTPGANKLYRARESAPHEQGGARVVQRFAVEAGATLEWLPQETIAYDGARARLSTAVVLDEGATYAGWELLCLGRPACDERFTRGALNTELTIARAGRLVYFERGQYRGGARLLAAPWGLAGFPVLGTLVVAAPQAEASWVERLRTALEPELACASTEPSAPRLGATLVAGTVVVRVLAGSTREARGLFERAHSVLRPLYAGRSAVHPRIWST